MMMVEFCRIPKSFKSEHDNFFINKLTAKNFNDKMNFNFKCRVYCALF